MSNTIFKKLQSEAEKSYVADGSAKSAAIVFADDGSEFLGLRLGLKNANGSMTAISGAICIAIGEGKRDFTRVVAFFDCCADYISLDPETISLIEEFHINDVVAYDCNGILYELNSSDMSFHTIRTE